MTSLTRWLTLRSTLTGAVFAVYSFLGFFRGDTAFDFLFRLGALAAETADELPCTSRELPHNPVSRAAFSVLMPLPASSHDDSHVSTASQAQAPASQIPVMTDGAFTDRAGGTSGTLEMNPSRLPSVLPAAPPPPALPATVPAVDTPVKEPGGGGRPSAADTPGPSDRELTTDATEERSKWSAPGPVAELSCVLPKRRRVVASEGIDSTWLQPLAPQDRIPKRRWIRRFAEDVLKTLQSAGGDATGSVARDIESRQKAPAVGYATHTLALPPRKRLAIASGDTSARVAGRLPSVPPAAPPPPELPATVPAVDTPVKEPGGGGRPSAADTPGPSDRGKSVTPSQLAGLA
ncbi:hypothetical protein BESB_054280 [Besnoitia besnoiti]|uniref:Uncharacterized protein n=1 Tax=Besnoitia besnoiti TaxID=94643 RepID=A0A2A9MJK5_BESBE|nr:hypothetical protein BESB_054280 [Besnoitia besnoiti]PFH35777.1 hypothetical protein BESB_054280 [Besnoitia besnoiti]